MPRSTSSSVENSTQKNGLTEDNRAAVRSGVVEVLHALAQATNAPSVHLPGQCSGDMTGAAVAIHEQLSGVVRGVKKRPMVLAYVEELLVAYQNNGYLAYSSTEQEWRFDRNDLKRMRRMLKQRTVDDRKPASTSSPAKQGAQSGLTARRRRQRGQGKRPPGGVRRSPGLAAG